jgi:histidinol dehydrogenase
MTLKIYEDWEKSRQTVLRRRDMSTLDEVPESVRAGIQRVFGEDLTPEAVVARILADVRGRGNDALRDWSARIDGLTPHSLEVPAAALEPAYRAIPPDLAGALDLAAERIRAFHARQPIPSWSTDKMGGVLGQRAVPLQRVGVYVPGGTAPLPSSLLMAVIPARVAGVEEVLVCTPPGHGDGRVSDVMLAAAHVAGVDRLFLLGGALAIGALAYGTATVPRVDKIVGAGGLFTTLAKRQVYGQVGLDGLYGPTETVVVADDSANPAWVAADLLAQAEHDVLATAILLTPSRPLAEAVQVEVARQVEDLNRASVIAASLAGQGGIVITPDLETAIRLADEFSPEHLCLSVRDPKTWAGRIRNAGGLFLGEHSFEVLGDYVAGPSHIMPTGGTARFNSPLNVLDFVKIVNVIGLDTTTAARLCPAAARIARAESLTAHGAAATARSSALPAPALQSLTSNFQPPTSDFPIYIGAQAIEQMIAYCQSHQAARFLLVSDRNTHAVLGHRVEASLRAQGWDVRTVVLQGPEVIADEAHIVQVLLHAGDEERTYVAVGSGTITDITRFCSHRNRSAFISLPTAPSVDGYTSIGAPLVVRRLKQTAITQPPAAIFADLQTLCEAPRDMVAAGFGDMLGKYTSLADWRLGALLWDEPYSVEVAQRARRAVQGCADSVEEIGQASPVGIRRLMEGLLESGLCMLTFGETRPASGSEHHLSHFWEMKLLQERRPAILHGAKVGIGTVLTARRYETIRSLSRQEVAERLAAAPPPGGETEIGRIRATYGALADQIIAQQQPFLEMTPTAFDALKRRIVDQWAQVQEIADSVPSAQDLARLLEQVGGPTAPHEIGLAEDEVQQALESAHYLRRRFTVAKLGHLLGLWSTEA